MTKVSLPHNNTAVLDQKQGKKNNMMMPGGMGPNSPEKKGNEQSFGRETEAETMNDAEDNGETENLLVPGKKISMDDFNLITVIGRGSFGKVFLVKKKDTGAAFAMKILKKD